MQWKEVDERKDPQEERENTGNLTSKSLSRIGEWIGDKIGSRFWL